MDKAHTVHKQIGLGSSNNHMGVSFTEDGIFTDVSYKCYTAQMCPQIRSCDHVTQMATCVWGYQIQIKNPKSKMAAKSENF